MVFVLGRKITNWRKMMMIYCVNQLTWLKKLTGSQIHWYAIDWFLSPLKKSSWNVHIDYALKNRRDSICQSCELILNSKLSCANKNGDNFSIIWIKNVTVWSSFLETDLWNIELSYWSGLRLGESNDNPLFIDE